MASNNLAIGTTANVVALMDPLLEKFNITEEIFKQYGDQFAAAYLMVRKMGAFKPVDQVKFYHFEDTRFQEKLVVENTATAAGAGLPLTFTLDPTTLGLNGESYARPWYNIVFPGGFVEGTITSVTPTNAPSCTIVVTPKDPSVTLSVVAGQELVVGAPNFGEGSNQPKGITPKLVRRDFLTQILKESYQNSGTAATDAASVSIQDYVASSTLSSELKAQLSSMGLGNTFVLLGTLGVEIRHAAQVAGMIYFGQENTNNITPIVDTDPNALDGTVRATKGLYHHIQDRGGVVNYTTGSFGLADYDACADYLQSQNVSALRPIMHLLGNKQQREIENALISSNAAVFTTYTKDTANKEIYAGAGKSMNTSYVEVTKGNYSFCQVLEPIFHDPATYGAVGYNTPNLGFMIPMTPGKDAKSRQPIDHMSVRYKQLGGYNRAYNVWNRGQTITNYDIQSLELQADLGLQVFGANQMIVLEGQ